MIVVNFFNNNFLTIIDILSKKNVKNVDFIGYSMLSCICKHCISILMFMTCLLYLTLKGGLQ